MATNKSDIIRADKEMTKLLKDIQKKHMLRKGIFVPTSRITLAMSRQYKKYPLITKELEEADLR